MAELVKKAEAIPLGFMDKLSDTVYLWRPDKQMRNSTSKDPRLVLILGWMGAGDRPLARYIREYQTRYPSSSLLLIKARLPIMLSPAIARKDVSAAIPVLEEFTQESSECQPKLLVHLFSNGGSCLLCTLYDTWSKRPGVKAGSRLPLHVTIFDSAPAMHYEADPAFTATMIGIPRGILYYIAWPLVKLASLIWWLQFRVLRFPDRMVQLAKVNNDLTKVVEARRVYMYSDKDVLVSMNHIKGHAADARRKGFVVAEEYFEGSPHVAHAKTEPARYWKAVDRAWLGS